MGKHVNGKELKDIRTELRKGELWRVIVFSDGTIDEKRVGEAQIKRMIDAIKSTPELTVIQGGKRKSQSGKGAADALGFLVLAFIFAMMAMGLSSWIPDDDDMCTGPNWHKYSDCY